jgi:hypothetical protein
LSSHGQGGVADAIRVGMSQRPGGVIIGSDPVEAAVAESLRQVSHGAGSETEGRREAGGRLAVLGALE